MSGGGFVGREIRQTTQDSYVVIICSVSFVTARRNLDNIANFRQLSGFINWLIDRLI